MTTMLMAWYFACVGPNFNYESSCSNGLHRFQYALQVTLQNDEILPYRSLLDKDCSEMPESCKAFEAVNEWANSWGDK